MSYFANYAFWNYFTLPALLMNDRIHWEEKTPGHLKARFPSDVPTNCPKQDFFFDSESGLLKQHNYNADIITKLATAANVVNEHKSDHGILYPSRRIVSPRTKSGKARSKPVLIDITVHEFRLIP